MDIKNSVILVTGGGSGIGAVVCQYLASLGATLVVLDRSQDAAAQVAKAINGFPVACDVADAAGAENAFKAIATQYPQGLTALINCAGIAPGKRIVGKEGPMPLDWFDNVIKINLVGTFNMMRLAAANMIAHSKKDGTECGVIINTASVAAFEGQIGQAAYSASKGGVVAMTLPAARELAAFGIRVMTIAPGFIDTPMLQGMPDNVRQSLIAQTVFPKRLGKPEEFARLAAHIIENPLLNGSVIRLDGAVRMQDDLKLFGIDLIPVKKFVL